MDEAKSLRGFLAAEAVRNQGPDVFSTFVCRLLDAVHRDKKPVHEDATIFEVARSIPELDETRMLADIERPELRQRIARDYEIATNREGVFGTPTFSFPGGDAVFLKMSTPAPGDADALFRELQSLVMHRPYVRELKKTQRPGDHD